MSEQEDKIARECLFQIQQAAMALHEENQQLRNSLELIKGAKHDQVGLCWCAEQARLTLQKVKKT